MKRPCHDLIEDGFTLVELLVVVGILAVLLGVLIPVMGQARGRANSAACLNNLRQLGSAMHAYALENNGALPRRGQGVQPTVTINRSEDWFNALPPALGMERFYDLVTQNKFPRPGTQSIWSCPDLPDTGQPYFWSYGMNMWLSVWNTSKPDRLTGVGPASSLVMFADGPGNYCSVLPSNKGYSPVARHKGSVNLCFLDGHVATFPGSYVGCGVGLPDRPDIVWKVASSTWGGPPP